MFNFAAVLFWVQTCIRSCASVFYSRYRLTNSLSLVLGGLCRHISIFMPIMIYPFIQASSLILFMLCSLSLVTLVTREARINKERIPNWNNYCVYYNYETFEGGTSVWLQSVQWPNQTRIRLEVEKKNETAKCFTELSDENEWTMFVPRVYVRMIVENYKR